MSPLGVRSLYRINTEVVGPSDAPRVASGGRWRLQLAGMDGSRCHRRPSFFTLPQNIAGRRFFGRSPSAAQPQPNFGISPAKTQSRKGRKIMVKKLSKIIYLFPPNLACFAPWRESIPCVRVPDTGKFARAAQTFKHSSIVKRLRQILPPGGQQRLNSPIGILDEIRLE